MWTKNLNVEDTIYALSSGALPSAVAVVRLSGPRALEIAAKVFKTSSIDFPNKRGMYLGKLLDGEGAPIDPKTLALAFPGGGSFTGESVVEFQCHGSLAVVSALQRCLLAEGARAARAGEFSYRAFLNEKLDARGLEEIGDLFHARDQADLSGILERDASMGSFVSRLRDRLIQLQAVLDTAVDFSEEYSTVLEAAKAPTTQAIHECSLVIQRFSRLKESDSVPLLVLAGSPNAGKSSLFNALLGKYRALVNSQPGTTRDAVEVDMEFGRNRWRMVDTAGVRETQDEIESGGLALGGAYLSAASFWVLVVDGTQGLSETDRRLLVDHGSRPHCIVWNKSDLSCVPLPEIDNEKALRVSALSGEGMGPLVDFFLENLGEEGGQRQVALPTASQTALLKSISASLEEIASGLSVDVPPEVLAEVNRRVLSQVEEIIGYVDTEMILDRVFGEFCIGK